MNTKAAKGVEVKIGAHLIPRRKDCRSPVPSSRVAVSVQAEGSRVKMLGIRVYGWLEGVSIIHKVRPRNTA